MSEKLSALKFVAIKTAEIEKFGTETSRKADEYLFVQKVTGPFPFFCSLKAFERREVCVMYGGFKNKKRPSSAHYPPPLAFGPIVHSPGNLTNFPFARSIKPLFLRSKRILNGSRHLREAHSQTIAVNGWNVFAFCGNESTSMFLFVIK